MSDQIAPSIPIVALPGSDVHPHHYAGANDSARTETINTATITSPSMQTFFLGGLFVFALLTACWAAAEILVPVVLAFVLKLVFSPVMRFLESLRVPRVLAALMIIFALLGGCLSIGSALATPAEKWAQQLPRTMDIIENRMEDVNSHIAPLQNVLNEAEKIGARVSSEKTVTVQVDGSGWKDTVFKKTGRFIIGFAEMLLVLFYLLAAGDTFLRRTVEILPRYRDKKQAIAIATQIERDISGYLLTITFMNALVGIATTIVMHLCGLSDPILWGVMAFVLNYIPVAGPLACTVMFLIVGTSTEANMQAGLMPAIAYFGIHILESEVLTTFLLARQFTLNPVLVMLGLIFFFWIWGVPGVILATPIIAITKIIFDNINSLKPMGHFMEG